MTDRASPTNMSRTRSTEQPWVPHQLISSCGTEMDEMGRGNTITNNAGINSTMYPNLPH